MVDSVLSNDSVEETPILRERREKNENSCLIIIISLVYLVIQSLAGHFTIQA